MVQARRMLILFKHPLHHETFCSLKVPEVEGNDRKTEGTGGRGTSKITGTHGLAFLDKVCLGPDIGQSRGEVKGADGKELNNPLDVGFSSYPSGLGIGTMNTMEEFRDA